MIDPEALEAARAKLTEWPDWETRHNQSGPVKVLPNHMASPAPKEFRVSVGTEVNATHARINAERRKRRS